MVCRVSACCGSIATFFSLEQIARRLDGILVFRKTGPVAARVYAEQTKRAGLNEDMHAPSKISSKMRAVVAECPTALAMRAWTTCNHGVFAYTP